MRKSAGEIHLEWSKQYGPLVRYSYANLTLPPSDLLHHLIHTSPHPYSSMVGIERILVTDPAMVKHILLNSQLFDKKVHMYSLVAKSIGKGIPSASIVISIPMTLLLFCLGLVTQEDEAIHKYHHSIILPAFTMKHLKVWAQFHFKKIELNSIY